MPATMLAALSDRTNCRRSTAPLSADRRVGGRRWRRRHAAVADAGAAVQRLVPLLLGFATLLFAFADRIGAAIRKRAEGRGHDITSA